MLNISKVSSRYEAKHYVSKGESLHVLVGPSGESVLAGGRMPLGSPRLILHPTSELVIIFFSS